MALRTWTKSGVTRAVNKARLEGIREGRELARPKTAKDVLAILREFYAEGIDPRSPAGDERRVLWDVLSALRGPDGDVPGAPDAWTAKAATTAVVRYAAVGRGVPVMVDQDGVVQMQIRKSMATEQDRRPGNHFYSHVRRAFFVLGLMWDAVNPAS